MEKKRDFYRVVEELCRKDKRYKADAYEFVMQALHFTQKKLKRQTHVTGKELLGGIKEFTIEQYGLMSMTLLRHWGIENTLDFGNIVFNMVEEKLLSRTEEDSLEDFKEVYDFEQAFGNVLEDTKK